MGRLNLDQLTCPLCGSRFQPSGEAACAACPLHSDCAMVCCPSCGYTMLAPARSGLARGVARALGALRRLAAGDSAPGTGLHQTLAGAPVGAEVRIVAFDDLAAEHYDWLQAYGLMPGHCVRVLQQRPITIVQVEQA